MQTIQVPKLNRKYLLILPIFLLLISVYYLATNLKTPAPHYQITVPPLKVDEQFQEQNIYLSNSLTAKDSLGIFSNGSRLYSLTSSGVTDLQSGTNVLPISSPTPVSLDSNGGLIVEKNIIKFITIPFISSIPIDIKTGENYILSPNNQYLASCQLDQIDISKLVDPSTLIASFKPKNQPSCAWGDDNSFLVQVGTTLTIIRVNSASQTIILDESEVAIKIIGEYLYTNKNGVLGQRTTTTARGFSFRTGSTLYPYHSGDANNLYVVEIIPGEDLNRGYLWFLNQKTGQKNLFTSTRPIPASIDLNYRPIHIPEKDIFIVRTINNEFWLISSQANSLPILTPEGIDNKSTSANSFTFDD